MLRSWACPLKPEAKRLAGDDTPATAPAIRLGPLIVDPHALSSVAIVPSTAPPWNTVATTAQEWLSAHSIVSLLENRTWTGGRFGSMHPCLPPTASSLPTEPYLNLRSCFPQFNDLPHLVRRRSAPEFQEKGAGNVGIGDRHSTARIYERVDVLHGLYKLCGAADKRTGSRRKNNLVHDALVEQADANSVQNSM